MVAPATANILAKFAAGIADDLLSTTYLAMRCPALLAPAMNAAMWKHPATQKNAECLRAWGARFCGPARGRLACGDEDVGRMEEPQAILRAIEDILRPKQDFIGRRVLVTAGPTREMLDPVRFLTNRSTGKMGFAIAEAARDRGATVTLVSGPVSLPAPAGVEFVPIVSCAELCEAVLSRAEGSDVVVQAAAPADSAPAPWLRRRSRKAARVWIWSLKTPRTSPPNWAGASAKGKFWSLSPPKRRTSPKTPAKSWKRRTPIWWSPRRHPPRRGLCRRHQRRDHLFPGRRAGSTPARQARGGRSHPRPRIGAVLMYANVILDRVSDALDHVFHLCRARGHGRARGPAGVRAAGKCPRGRLHRRTDGRMRAGAVAHQAHSFPARGGAVILPELMALAKWMRLRYNCNLVEALRLMLPAGMRRGSVREKTRRVAHLAAPDFAARGSRQQEIVARLRAGDVETSLLPAAPLRALVQKGVVKVYKQGERRAPAVLRGETLPDPPLTRAQGRAVSELCAALEHGGGRFLLHGVTGSGKTEVYIRLVRRALEVGKSAIVLVPEIALTPQMVSWFHQRFGADAAVLHSGLSQGERFDEWRRIRSGEARVVIGARSAVFAPLANVGVIVVDEEHEGSYQSDRRPRYDAREVAWRRAEGAGAVLLLGSATPSIASYMRSMPGVRPENRLTLIELPERVGGRPLPEVEVVDMRREFERGNRSIFSARLSEELRDCLERGRQAMLLINRRGHSSFVSCRKCGYVVKCAACDVSMTYHQAENVLRCHYCGAERAVPHKCPECGSPYIKFFGVGTEQVVEEVKRQFRRRRCCAWTMTPRAKRTPTPKFSKPSGRARPTYSSARR